MVNKKRLAALFAVLFIGAASAVFFAARPNVYEAAPASPVLLPILMFHSVSVYDVGVPDMIVTQYQLRAYLAAMQDAGYTAITFGQLEDYLAGRGTLPQNPFIITFDDGYLDNYTLAFPVLEELGMPAVFNILGLRRGQDTYMGRPSVPHFTWEQARRLYDSGFIEFGNHSWDMHGAPGITPGRLGLTKLAGETYEEFADVITLDLRTMHGQFFEVFGRRSYIYAYPFGWLNEFTESILRENGYRVTLGTEEFVNMVQTADDLFAMGRINVNAAMTPGDLLYRVGTLAREAYFATE